MVARQPFAGCIERRYVPGETSSKRYVPEASLVVVFDAPVSTRRGPPGKPVLLGIAVSVPIEIVENPAVQRPVAGVSLPETPSTV
jgi:hypothetical protein